MPDAWSRALVCLAGALIATAPLAHAQEDNDSDQRPLSIIGNAEEAVIVDGGIVMKAKVDTGADSTSIDARKVETFTREGADWVRFETRTNGDEVVTFEREVVDTVTIIGAGDEEQERLVVDIGLCVGNTFRNVKVNLADRSGLDYRLLLGRGFLESGGFLVNVAQEFSLTPSCDEIVER